SPRLPGGTDTRTFNLKAHRPGGATRWRGNAVPVAVKRVGVVGVATGSGRNSEGGVPMRNQHQHESRGSFDEPHFGALMANAERPITRRTWLGVMTGNVEDLDTFKRQLGVPRALWSCHTALVGNYIIEGHVPADVINRARRELPSISGLAVAGMP